MPRRWHAWSWRSDAGKADAGNAVHLERNEQAVPVDRAVFVKVVDDGQARRLSLLQPDERRRHRSIDPDRAADLAVEPHLVDASGESIGGVEHLVRSRRDAQRPRRARCLRQRAAGRFELGDVGDFPDRRLGTRRHRHVDADLAQQVAFAVEHLDAAVAAVGDVDIALRVGGDAMRRVELARLVAAVAP